MNIKAILTATLLALSSATSVSAATLDFNFTFTEINKPLPRTYFGTIFGLKDNATSSASMVTVEWDSTILSRQRYLDTDATANSFTVINGQLIIYGFSAVNSNGQAGGLFFLNNSIIPVYRCEFLTCDSSSGFRHIIAEFTPVSQVPLPAGSLLLLSAVGGIAALKRRKKPAA